MHSISQPEIVHQTVESQTVGHDVESETVEPETIPNEYDEDVISDGGSVEEDYYFSDLRFDDSEDENFFEDELLINEEVQ